MPWCLQAKGLSAINRLTRNYPRICIASTGGGCGKTLLSLGLARLWARQGFSVKPFKKGPDYIDAAWLAAAAGNSTTNLDPFFLSPDRLAAFFQQSIHSLNAASLPLAILEGNRGLYDGLNETGECSTAQVARAIACPILLSINCEKATRTIAALIKGLTSFEQGLDFAGVVLNRTGSSRHEHSLRQSIEANTDLTVLGAMPRLDPNPLLERHMGLACQGGLGLGSDQTLENIANFIENNCDSEAIRACAYSAPSLPVPPMELCSPAACLAENSGPTIGVVKDEALWFYYPENIAALEASGAKINFLSLFDTTPASQEKWENIDGLYLGGGFPEDFAAEIASSPYLIAIKDSIHKKMPVYAECGGMILLCKSLTAKGRTWPMAGVIPAKAQWLPKPQGLGYVQALVTKNNPYYPEDLEIRGHEFHYTRLIWEHEPGHLALQLRRGSGLYKTAQGRIEDGVIVNNAWGSWMHVFAPAVPVWAKSFASLAKTFQANREKNC